MERGNRHRQSRVLRNLFSRDGGGDEKIRRKDITFKIVKISLDKNTIFVYNRINQHIDNFLLAPKGQRTIA